MDYFFQIGIDNIKFMLQKIRTQIEEMWEISEKITLTGF